MLIVVDIHGRRFAARTPLERVVHVAELAAHGFIARRVTQA
jgi:hypothetical protein